MLCQPWYTTVSIKIVSVSDISAVNFIVGCKVYLLERNNVWFTYVRWGKSVIYVAFSIGLNTVFLKLCVSILLYTMKMLGKKTAVFVLIAVPWVCTDSAFH